LNDKAIVVTGAGRGLGRAYAIMAAEHGAKVVVNDVDADVAEEVADEVRSAGGEATSVTQSVASWEGAAAIVQACLDSYGAIDGLVNNAAISTLLPAGRESEETVRRQVEINLVGSTFCGLQALRAMADQGHGSLVNVVSGAALGAAGRSVYGATKAGMIANTYAWAAEFHHAGVRVNALSPIAWTRLAAQVEAELSPDVPAALRPQHIDPAEIAPLPVYLLSDRSCHVTGQVLRFDTTGISVLRPAEFLAPVEPSARTPEAVAETFATQVDALLQPVGQARQRLEAAAPPRT